MSNTAAAHRPNRLAIRTLNLRLDALRAELASDLTKRCGWAAANCIREDIATVEAQLRAARTDAAERAEITWGNADLRG